MHNLQYIRIFAKQVTNIVVNVENPVFYMITDDHLTVRGQEFLQGRAIGHRDHQSPAQECYQVNVLTD